MSTRDDAIQAGVLALLARYHVLRTELYDEVDATDDAEAVVDALLARFDLRPKATTAAPAPEPAVGQIWRNKRSDRLVRITEFTYFGSPFGEVRIRWEAMNGRGQKSGAVYIKHWRRNFTFALEADVP